MHDDSYVPQRATGRNNLMCDDRNDPVINRIKAAMQASDTNITALAKRAGLKYETLRSYLSGNRSLPARAIPDLARALDVSCDFILTGEPARMRAPALIFAATSLTNIAHAMPPDAPSPDPYSVAAQFYLNYRRYYLDGLGYKATDTSASDAAMSFLRRLHYGDTEAA